MNLTKRIRAEKPIVEREGDNTRRRKPSLQSFSTMSHVLPLTLTVTAILLFEFGLFSVPSVAQASAEEAALVHPNWVQVPGELIRPDCVHEVPNGATVEIADDGEATGDVTLNGSLIAHYDACPEPPVITRPHGSTVGLPNPPTTEGWVEASQWDVSLSQSDNVDFVAGYWTVPSNPSANGGLIYLFNGIEPSNFQWIMQPVLQYGKSTAGGGNYWAIASWFVGPSVYYSPLETVYPGNLVYGYTQMTGVSGSTLDWKIEAQDTTTGAYSWMSVYNYGYHWTWAFAAVLEAYGITSCSQFPSNGSDAFSASSVDHGFPSFEYINPQGWYGEIYPFTGGPSCGFKVSPGNTSTLYF